MAKFLSSVRQKDAKQKMKMYADKRANAKPSPTREGDTVLLRQEKKNKLSTPFEGIPYTVFQKKGSMVAAERTTDGRIVTWNTKAFKSCPPSTKKKKQTQTTLEDKGHDAIVAAKPLSKLSKLQRCHNQQVLRPHLIPLVLKNRDTREGRNKPAQFKVFVCG